MKALTVLSNLRRALFPTWGERYDEGWEYAKAITDPALGPDRVEPHIAYESAFTGNDPYDTGMRDYLYLRYQVGEFPTVLTRAHRSRVFNRTIQLYLALLALVLGLIALFPGIVEANPENERTALVTHEREHVNETH